MRLDDLKTVLRSIEGGILDVKLSQRDGLDVVDKQIDAAAVILSNISIAQHTDYSALQEIYTQARRIEAMASAFLELESAFKSRRDELVDKTSDLLQAEFRERSSSKALTKPNQAVLTPSDCLPSHHLRQYFLDHITGPYPNQRDKDHMLDKTNNDIMASKTNRQPMTPSQLTLWFINARRRSGWSQIMQKYGKNDRSFTKQLAEEILRLKKRLGDEGKIDTDDRE